jgi:Ca2+-binding EF-hand superfamily protein
MTETNEQLLAKIDQWFTDNDKDHNKTLEAAEIKALLVSVYGAKATNEWVDHAIKRIDRNKDGHISKLEVFMWLKHNQLAA